MTKEELLQGSEYIVDMINEIIRQQTEIENQETERELAKMIETYDFIVGSMECKTILMEILPDEANIIYSPYLTSPSTICAIKKFDISDLLD